MKLLVALLLLAGSALPALAQDGAAVTTTTVVTTTQAQVTPKDEPVEIPSSPLGDDVLRAVEKPSTQLTKRLFLVLDVSGSMRGLKLGRVLQTVSQVIQQPLDEAEVAIVTFNERSERWPGLPEPDADKPVPPGWARLPSVVALNYAQGWVASRDAGSSTDPTTAMNRAFEDTREGLSIVLVTDGEFNGPAYTTDDHAFDKLVADGQAERERKGLGRAPIMVFGVGASAERQEHLVRVGRDYGGGFWVDKDPEGKKTEEPMRKPWRLH